MKHSSSLADLMQIPGVGISLATDLQNIGILRVSDLVGKDAHELFAQSNHFAGQVQDRCVLYVFACAIYYAETGESQRDPELLKWWNWKPLV
jgi:predicted RecB family nuclease